MSNVELNKRQIKFHFHPHQYDEKNHTLEKALDGDKKRRYLCGSSSGLKIDGHGERMTQKAIDSFMKQANAGDILLYTDVHGIKATEDIGILTKAEILSNGDWYTEYRLYDEQDGVGQIKKETIDTIWKQINGFPPYKNPRQKGFSVEGFIPDTAILNNGLERKAIDDVDLDGVLLVPRPAYQDSVATAIMKALGETTPERTQSLQKSLQIQVKEKDINDAYYKYKWDFTDALERTIEQIMVKKNNNKKDELNIVFKEYGQLMSDLVIKSESVFSVDSIDNYFRESDFSDKETPEGESKETKTSSRLEMYKSLLKEITILRKSMEEQK